MTDTEKISAYLTRIGFTGTPAPNLATLIALQRAHLETVPYENLDIMRNIPISLNLDSLHEKIVIRRRGGYCFELNGLFTWLLRNLGFRVKEYLSRFLRGERGIPTRRHRVIHVSIKDEGDFLCDVGVGGTIPRCPLELILDTANEQNGEIYRIERKPILGYVLSKWNSGQQTWGQIYSFTLEEQLETDYIIPSFYCENHPASPFRTMDMVHIFTKDGRKSIAGREFRIFSPNGVETATISTDAEYQKILQTHFGIVLQ